MRPVNKTQIILGGTALFLGSLLYLTDRPPDQTYFVYHSGMSISLYGTLPNLFGLLGNSLPAFVHVFSFILLTAGLISCQRRGCLIICLGWFLVDAACELGQKWSTWSLELIPNWFAGIPFLENSENYFRLGTFDFFDLAVVNYGTPDNPCTSSVSILLQDPISPGAFLAPTDYQTGFRSTTVAISDLDADGWADLAVANSGTLIADYGPFSDSYSISGSVSVLLHNSANPGTFLPAKNYDATTGYHAVAIGDLTGDSRPDLAIAAHNVPVLFQDPTRPGQFLPGTPVETGSNLPP